MAIKPDRSEEGKLSLSFDNGDKVKFDEVLKEWNFKDEQSLIRFAMSIFLLSNKKSLIIHSEEGQKEITPADDYLKKQ